MALPNDVCKIAYDGNFDKFRNLINENRDLLTERDEVSHTVFCGFNILKNILKVNRFATNPLATKSGFTTSQ